MRKRVSKITAMLVAILLTGVNVVSISADGIFSDQSPHNILGESVSESAQPFPSLGDSSPSLGDSSTSPPTEVEAVLGMSTFDLRMPVIVNSFAQLEAAIIAKSPHITLAADIVMLKRLNITSSVIIDGDGYSISEGAKFSFIIQQDNIEIEMRNMSILGFFYYGFVSTMGSSLGKNAIVTYNNVVYYGPQLANLLANNTLRLIDSTIILENKTGSDPAQELAEVAFIEIGGTTLVHKTVGGDAFIWFVGSTTNLSGLTILDNATVTLINETTYFNYNHASLGVDFVMGENAQLNIRMRDGMNADAGHVFRNIIIKKNAHVQMESLVAIRPLAIKENLTIEDDATFLLSHRASATNPVLYFTLATATVTINNPKLVYIAGRKAGYSPNVKLDANVINTFYNTTPNNGGYPSNFTASNNGIANGHSTAYPGDFVNVTSIANPLNYFNRTDNNGFILGQFDMSTVVLNPPTAYDTVVTLAMPPQSEGKMTFTPRGETLPKSVTGIADGSGKLVLDSGISLDENGYGPFVVGADLQLVLREKTANTTGFLHVNRSVTVMQTGELSFESIPLLDFGTHTIHGGNMIIPLVQDATLSIRDDRATPTNWKVGLRAAQFTEVNGSKTLSPDALGILENGVFVSLKDAGIVWGSSTNLNQPIQSKIWQAENLAEGFVLQINPSQATTASYEAVVTWSLEIGP